MRTGDYDTCGRPAVTRTRASGLHPRGARRCRAAVAAKMRRCRGGSAAGPCRPVDSSRGAAKRSSMSARPLLSSSPLARPLLSSSPSPAVAVKDSSGRFRARRAVYAGSIPTLLLLARTCGRFLWGHDDFDAFPPRVRIWCLQQGSRRQADAIPRLVDA